MVSNLTLWCAGSLKYLNKVLPALHKVDASKSEDSSVAKIDSIAKALTKQGQMYVYLDKCKKALPLFKKADDMIEDNDLPTDEWQVPVPVPAYPCTVPCALPRPLTSQRGARAWGSRADVERAASGLCAQCKETQ